jgi:hypothetical protein
VMRCGLFFTVCTPSGVRVESMMYVGMVAPPSDFADGALGRLGRKRAQGCL